MSVSQKEKSFYFILLQEQISTEYKQKQISTEYKHKNLIDGFWNQ